jgi:hypothetical protein
MSIGFETTTLVGARLVRLMFLNFDIEIIKFYAKINIIKLSNILFN